MYWQKKKLFLISLSLLALVGIFAGCSKKKASEEVTSVGNDEMRRMQIYERAITQAQQSLQNNPKDITALIEIGDAYYDLGNNRSAIDYYTRALEIDPNNANVRTDMGTCYNQIGDLDRALEEYKKSLETNPKHLKTLFNRGIVMLQKGLYKEAIQSWEKYLELEPNEKLKMMARDYIERTKKAMEGAAAASSEPKTK